MKSRRLSRKSIVLLFAMVVFFCSLQSLSFGQNAEITIAPNSLSEATLDGSVVTLTLHGGLRFVQDVDRIKSGVIFSPTWGLTITEVTDRTDTTVKLRLQFSGDFDGPTTLTIAVRRRILENAEQDNFPVSLNIITTVESLTATTTPTSLTEATLGESTVTFTLQGRTFEADTQKIKDSVLFSGIGGVSAGSVERLSDTQVRMGLQYSGNSQGNNRTLRILMTDTGIKHYTGSDFTVEFPVTTTTESLTATALAPLTEATLDGSVVTLTLEGRTFEKDLRGHLAIQQSSVRIGTIESVSDTQVRVQLQFNGNFDRNTNLAFFLQSTGIKNYQGSNLRAEIPLTTTTESLTATALVPLTEATLNGSVVTLTLHGRTFEETVGQFVSVSGISGVSIGRIQRLNDTQVTVPLQFSGDFDSNRTLTFTVNEKDIKNYRCGACTYTLDLRAEVPVTAIVEPPTTTVPTRQPTVPPTPQPNAVHIPDPNLRAAVEQAIGNTITTDTMLRLTRVRASDRGITNLTGLEYAQNLTELSLGDNSITDISPLAGLTKLEHVYLYDNSISNISRLAGLTQLRTLWIYNNSITNISPLAGLTNLTMLLISHNSITNISPLAGLTNLSDLLINHNSISDISALSGLTKLTKLLIHHNSISDISSLAGLTKLTTLWINDNPLNAAAINTHIPAIQARGAEVLFNNRAPTTPPPPANVGTPPPPTPPANVGTPPQPAVGTPQIPDLIISGIRASKATLTPGEQFTLFATVENQGTRQSPATSLQFQRATPNFYTQIGTRNINALSANRSVEVNFSLTAPAQEGIYHYRAYIQISNNHSEWISITVAAPATTPQGVTPQPNVGTTPQPGGVDIPDPNLRAAIQRVIGTQITPQTMLNLTTLYAQTRGITNLTGLEYATNLIQLSLSGNSISDISSLTRLTHLTFLDLHNNSISDIAPLAGLTQLTELHLHYNSISDIAPLSRMTQLQKLVLGYNSISDIAALAGLTHLTELHLWEGNISDISPLARLTQLERLTIPENSISDVSALAGLTHLMSLNLRNNSISDVAALAGLRQLTYLNLLENPLNAAARNTHIPAIQARGTEVLFDNRAPTTPQTPLTVAPTPQPNVVPTPQPNVPPTPQPNVAPTSQPTVVSTPQPTVVRISDRRLRVAIQQVIGNQITTQTLLNLTTLDAYDLRISNLTGLEHATNLSELDLGGNSISDVAPLAGLTHLESLRLDDNNISDISPLVGLTRLTDLSLEENPLSAVSINTHIPAIQANGTQVEFDDRAPTTSPPSSVVSKPQPTVGTAATHPGIYWGFGDKIQRADLDGSNVHDVVTGLNPLRHLGLTSIAVDIVGGKIYWILTDFDTEPYTGQIQFANLDGSNVRTLVTGLVYPQSLALDVANGKMYWASVSNRNSNGKIQSANLDGSNVRDLLTGLDPLRGIAVDVAGRRIYWTDWDTIQSADLDGANLTELASGYYNMSTLALDIVGRQMYWTDVSDRGGSIYRADLDGANLTELLLRRETFPEDITLDVAGGKMYWANRTPSPDGEAWEPPDLLCADLDGSNLTELVPRAAADVIANVTLGIPPQTVASGPTKTVQVHVNAADRPPMYWIDTAAGTLHRLVDAEVENLVPSVQNATSLTVDIATNTLYWTQQTGKSSGTIHSANLDGSGAMQLVESRWSVPMGIAVDTADNHLYWTNSSGKIKRANLDGKQGQNVLKDLPEPMDLALAGGAVYWTQATGSVRFVNLQGTKNVRNIATGTDTPLNLAVGGGKVYWTQQTGESSGTIHSANLDGSGVTKVVSAQADVPMGIAVDTARSKLYWTNSNGEIKRANLDGSNPQKVVEGLGPLGELVIGGIPLDDQMTDDVQMTDTTPQTTAPATTDRAEDVNQDGKVDHTDVGIVAAALFGGNPPANPGRLDVNGDGVLNIQDLMLIENNLDEEDAAGAPALDIQLNALVPEKIQAAINVLLATDDGSLGRRRTLAYLQNLLAMARPDETQLFANYPNPFNPETWLPYQLSTGSDVRIIIYDMRGKVIRRLILGYQSAGYYTSRSRAAYWDGRNALGEQVASGIYFYQFETDEMSAMRKMVILK